MKRLIPLLVVACVTLLHARASAMTEFCPATLSIGALGAHASPPNSGSVFAFRLSSLKRRTLSAKLGFDTSLGWYTAEVPGANIARPGSANPPYRFDTGLHYVRFPQGLLLYRAWVISTNRGGDSVQCTPPTAKSWLKPPFVMPQNATPISPVASTALGSRDCASAFSDAKVIHAIDPPYPNFGIDGMRPQGRSNVVVAIDEMGRVVDAAVSRSSGYKAMDDATLRAARASTYRAGRAYCKAVPGLYIFSVKFQ